MELLSNNISFQRLLSHANDLTHTHLYDLFNRDQTRFSTMSLKVGGVLLDYSKNLLDDTSLPLLFTLAKERHIESARHALFTGGKINNTENRAALHTALRAPQNIGAQLFGHDIADKIHATLARMKIFTNEIHSGQWTGYTGKKITDIIHIGVGGSDLGPRMVCRALHYYAHPNIKIHFVANTDGHDLSEALEQCQPETSLFIIASKSFTTSDTCINAQSARDWFVTNSRQDKLDKHFIAVSANINAAQEFGIQAENIFPFWDWVGGRYSVWSAIGLTIALATSFDCFSALLAGAHEMDTHFYTAPISHNMPIILAMIGIYNRNILGMTSLSIAPYLEDLHLLPSFLQQLDMESNGKSTTKDGKLLDVASGPVIWGNSGTNCQHAYFQLLHQSADIIPVDFIAAIKPNHRLTQHHKILLANCFAQSKALMRGKSKEEVRAEMQEQQLDATTIEALLPHRTFSGNRPSNTILLDALTPTTLGALMALYEHKVFVQGIIWNINSFDQWGVELGKALAKQILLDLDNNTHKKIHDSSTNGLIAAVQQSAK